MNQFKKAALVFGSVSLLMAGSSTATADAASQSANTFADAVPIQPGVSHALTGQIAPAGDDDYYQFSATGNKTYVVEAFNVSSSIRNLALYVFDSSGNQVADTSLCNGSGNVCSRVQFTAGVTGTYYLEAFSWTSSQTGTYSIRVLPAFSKNGADGEPNDAPALAEPITPGVGTALKRTIYTRNPSFSTYSGDSDFYRFRATGSKTYVVEAFNVSSSIRNLALYALDSSGNQVAGTSLCNGSGNACSRVQFTAGLTGTYYLEAFSWTSSQSGTYSIRVLPAFSKNGADGEPNDAPALAEPITPGVGTALKRTIYTRNPSFSTYSGDSDFYRFRATGSKTYVVEAFNVSSSIRNLALYALDSSGNQVAGTSLCNASGSVCSRVQFTAGLTGTYYLEAFSWTSSESGTYSIRVLPKQPG